jgi:hypothetical protein
MVSESDGLLAAIVHFECDCESVALPIAIGDREVCPDCHTGAWHIETCVETIDRVN